MGPVRIFEAQGTMFGRGKKKSENPSTVTPEVNMGNRLQELCAGDDELYHALSGLMFLDPKKITYSIDAVLSEAQEYEKKGNNLRAEVAYRIAGGISLYKGDVDGVRKYFSKAGSFANVARPEYGTVAKKAENAVGVAKKYYEDSSSGTRV